jgi:hypothetical protein
MSPRANLLLRSSQERNHHENLTNKQRAAAAEVALKAHVLKANPGMLSELPDGRSSMEDLTELVNLTEAPEDAVCDLVMGRGAHAPTRAGDCALAITHFGSSYLSPRQPAAGRSLPAVAGPLMHYCHREKIDRTDNIMRRACNHFRCERTRGS